MLTTPVPFPSEAAYETQKVSVFSYAGKGLAADVGASLSTITNGSVWLVPMLTDRGSLVKLYGGDVTLTRVTFSGGAGAVTIKPAAARGPGLVAAGALGLPVVAAPVHTLARGPPPRAQP